MTLYERSNYTHVFPDFASTILLHACFIRKLAHLTLLLILLIHKTSRTLRVNSYAWAQTRQFSTTLSVSKHYNRLGILWLGKYDSGWLVTTRSHILLGLDLWGVQNQKIWLAIIFHCRIRRMYRIRRLGTTGAFIGNNREHVWCMPSHMWQSYFPMSHILQSHFDDGFFFSFLGSPWKNGLP